MLTRYDAQAGTVVDLLWEVDVSAEVLWVLNPSPKLTTAMLGHLGLSAIDPGEVPEAPEVADAEWRTELSAIDSPRG